ARFPEGILGRSGAHDVCQSGELSSPRSSNLRRYPWSLASQVLGHPYPANRTDGLAYRCRPAQMDCRGSRLSQVDKNEAWILHSWQPHISYLASPRSDNTPQESCSTGNVIALYVGLGPLIEGLRLPPSTPNK